MPFDPTLPASNSPNSSAQMRAQLNGLKDLIDAVSGVTSAQVDAVNTLPAGSPATVAVSVSGTVLHLSFDLPQGNDGGVGPPGGPFTNFIVDGVTTLNPGDNATVQANFDGSAVRLNFGIPRGGDGASATPVTTFLVDAVNTLPPGDAATVQASFDGSAVHFVFNLPRGAEGAQGAAGEVTNAQLASAISGTSANSNAVGTLNLTVSDPPTQGEVQAIANKLDELILALRR